MYFSQFWRLFKIKVWQGQFLVRTLFQVCRWPPSYFALIRWNGREKESTPVSLPIRSCLVVNGLTRMLLHYPYKSKGSTDYLLILRIMGAFLPCFVEIAKLCSTVPRKSFYIKTYKHMIYLEHFSILISSGHSCPTLDYFRYRFNKGYPQKNQIK